MIKANELRVGNTIESLVGGQWYKHAVTAQTIELFSNDPFDMANKFNRPIPLSEDLLLRLGFKQNGADWSKDDFAVFDCNLYKEKSMKLKFNATSCPLPFVKYLHQIQNLYFALTGQELTLTP